jgi:hypothetical protein
MEAEKGGAMERGPQQNDHPNIHWFSSLDSSGRRQAPACPPRDPGPERPCPCPPGRVRRRPARAKGLTGSGRASLPR